MNVKNLEVGKEYKNMKDMCEQLGLTYKDSTDSRKAIIKEVERYAKLEKRGRKFLVVEIHDEIKEKVDGRVNNGHHENSRNAKTIYAEYIDKLMLDNLSRSAKISCNTKSNLAIEIGIINHNYRLFKHYSIAFNKYVELKKGIINPTVIRNVDYNLKTSIELVKQSLDRLERKGYISYIENYTFKIDTKLMKEEDIVTKEEVDGQEITRIANDEEIKDCCILEEKLLKKYGVKEFYELSNEKRSEYCKEYLKRIKMKYPYIIQVWKGYEITKINVTKEHMLDLETKDKNKKKLNDLIIEKVISKLKSDIKKIEEKCDKNSKKKLESFESHQLDSRYILDSSELLYEIANIQANRIRMENVYNLINK